MTDQPAHDPYFDHRTTSIIKGVALILMFVHHFFTFPEWYLKGIGYPWSDSFAELFQIPTEICVPIFAFLTGYFYFFFHEKSFRHSLKKILDIFIPYWVIFIGFRIFAYATGYWGALRNTFRELFALEDAIMVFCWYVPFYSLSMLVLPLFIKFIPQGKFSSFLVGIVVPAALLTVIQNSKFPLPYPLSILPAWFPCIAAGYLFAQQDLFQEGMEPIFSDHFSKWARTLIGILLMISAFWLRGVWSGTVIASIPYRGNHIPIRLSMDIIYVPCFIYGLISLLHENRITRPLNTILAAIGQKSMYMWFLHCIFFNVSARFFQPILYFPRNPILVLIWGLALCYGGALVVDAICKPLIRWKNQLLKL